ncbi:MAG: HpaII family restriction endonuclease [Lachnospiraceae bacterium]|nr:HpaII family restriction endonuclease [Lachnospiraceae bacterium]
MNRGEWGEAYTALRLLGDKRLFITDENDKNDKDEWMEVLKVIRRETNDRVVTYEYSADGETVDILINNNNVSSVPSVSLLNTAELLKHEIINGRGRSFNVSDEIITFLNDIEIQHLKAKSIEKSDIFLDVIDPRSSTVRENIGFSIKCEFGENPTLFNTGKASAAKYKIQGMTPQLMKEINALVDSKNHAAVSDRCNALKGNGCNLDFVGYEFAKRAKCNAFEENLELINPLLPKVIERIMWNHFMDGCNKVDIPSVINQIIIDNPVNISRPKEKYPYMMKMFLYSAYCGMTAGTLWDGKSAVKGGYITVKETGEVVANYALESDSFKEFLYKHCYLDYPSTDEKHGDYGKVYIEDGEYYFKLNFQIRIK